MARYTQLHQSDIQKIVDNYDLTVADFEPMEGGAANSSYLLHTREGKYVLTVFDKKAVSDVVKIGQLLLLLAEYDFPTTRLLPATSGDIVTLYMSKPVMLKAYIDGQVDEQLDEAMLHRLGMEMAKLHQIPSPDFLPDKHPYGRQLFSSVIDRNIDPQYESWLAKQLVYLERNIPPELPCRLIHGDLFYDNVLFDRKKFKAIIDFEEACCYYKVFDLGMGIVGLCTESTTVALDKARNLVSGYQQVQKLEDIEKETLQLFVEYAATATSYWRFWKYRIDTPGAEKPDKHWQMVRLTEGVNDI